MDPKGIKIAEGTQHMQAAAKAVKTSMFKWKPDWEEASQCFDKAGQSFKLGKDYSKAMDAFKQGANAHKEAQDNWNAAKSLEKAAECARELKEIELAMSLCRDAATLYRRNGVPDAAASALEASAKNAEKQGMYEEASELYMQVAEIMDEEDKPRRQRVPLERAVGCLIRAKNYQRAMDAMKKQALLYSQINEVENANKNILGRIILFLAIGDFPSAESLFEEGLGSSFMNSTEQHLADDMLTAYDESDQEGLDAITRKQHFSFLQNDVAVLARKLKAEGGGVRNKNNVEVVDFSKLKVEEKKEEAVKPVEEAEKETARPVEEEKREDVKPSEQKNEEPAEENKLDEKNEDEQEEEDEDEEEDDLL